MRQPSFDSVKEMLRHFTSTTPAPRPARPEAFTPGHPCGSTLPQLARHVQAALSRSTPGGMPRLHPSGGLPRRAGAPPAPWGEGWPPAGGARGGLRRACSRGRQRKNSTRSVFSGLPAVRSCPAFSGLRSQPLAEAPPQLPQRCRAHLREAGPPDCITAWRLTGGIGSASRG